MKPELLKPNLLANQSARVMIDANKDTSMVTHSLARPWVGQLV